MNAKAIEKVVEKVLIFNTVSSKTVLIQLVVEKLRRLGYQTEADHIVRSYANIDEVLAKFQKV